MTLARNLALTLVAALILAALAFAFIALPAGSTLEGTPTHAE